MRFLSVLVPYEGLKAPERYRDPYSGSECVQRPQTNSSNVLLSACTLSLDRSRTLRARLQHNCFRTGSARPTTSPWAAGMIVHVRYSYTPSSTLSCIGGRVDASTRGKERQWRERAKFLSQWTLEHGP